MTPFTLEKYLKDPTQQLVTRDGKPVRIVCSNRIDNNDDGSPGSYPIMALIKQHENFEEYVTYTTNGVICKSFGPSPKDLFFATKQQTRWINIYRNIYHEELSTPFDTEAEARTAAKNSSVQVLATAQLVTWEE